MDLSRARRFQNRKIIHFRALTTEVVEDDPGAVNPFIFLGDLLAHAQANPFIGYV